MDSGREYYRSSIVTSEKSEQTAASSSSLFSSKAVVPAKRELCRYYGMPGGCARGDKCYYAHGKEDLQMRPGTSRAHLNGAAPFQRVLKMNISSPNDMNKKVFVGGLSPCVESDALRSSFGEKFGPVVDAVVIGTNSGDQVRSRGFGFVTFKYEQSVFFAVQTRYINIFGKKVEIKSAVPRSGLSQIEVSKATSHGALSRTVTVSDLAAEASEGSTSSLFSCKVPPLNLEVYANGKCEAHTQEIKRGLGYQGSDDEQASPPSASASGRCSLPVVGSNVQWVSRFKIWLPRFLKEASQRMKEGECYPLSSLKGDFRATCGLELDHEGFGCPKLSDFIKSLPELCKVKVVPVGVGTAATHMVLIPLATRMTLADDQEVEEHGQMKGLTAGRSYAAATCSGRTSNDVDCASSASIGPQMRAINKLFDDYKVSTESLAHGTIKHLAESNGNEITRSAPVSPSHNGGDSRVFLSSNHHEASVSPRGETDAPLWLEEARAFLFPPCSPSENGDPVNLPENREAMFFSEENACKQNGSLNQEFGNGSGKTSHVSGIHNNVSLQASTSHGFQKMKSGTNGHSHLENTSFPMEHAPDRNNTADSEVRWSEKYLFCLNQAPGGSHTTKPFTNNFTKEPTSPVSEVTFTPCSTTDNQLTPFTCDESSASESSSSYYIWAGVSNVPHIFFNNCQETSAELPEKSIHSFEFPNGESKGKGIVQDMYCTVSNEDRKGKEQVEDTYRLCAFCSTRTSDWMAFPCKHFTICSPCRDAFYHFKGDGYYPLRICIVSSCGRMVERWVALDL